jgi:hypothetical protein
VQTPGDDNGFNPSNYDDGFTDAQKKEFKSAKAKIAQLFGRATGVRLTHSNYAGFYEKYPVLLKVPFETFRSLCKYRRRYCKSVYRK